MQDSVSCFYKSDEMNVKSVFIEHFGYAPEMMAKSPGRINLIGEHTDYNLGFVLPAAIDLCAYVAVAKRDDTIIRLFAKDLDEKHEIALDSLVPVENHWSAYVLGVVDQLLKSGKSLTGFDLVLTCDVPIGAGMSSSAAVECSTAFALNELFGLNLDRIDMVRLAQKAENDFVGVKCGIMDMFASVMGKDAQAIQLDCRDLSYQYFPLNLEDYKIVLFDTGVKHSLAGGEYNLRRQQCEQGVAVLQQRFPSLQSLRDVELSMLDDAFRASVTELVYKRCQYVIEENIRLEQGCALLIQNDIKGFGDQMYGSHKGLSELYEVSCKELDFLVSLAKQEESIAGARMMGGGFGGCTINLVKADAVQDLYDRFSQAYQSAMGKELKMYVTAPSTGSSLVDMV
jgi:galactokinase